MTAYVPDHAGDDLLVLVVAAPGPRLHLSGNGKTAIEASYGKYMTPNATGCASQFNPVALAFENRAWTDVDRSGQNLATNGDGIAQDNEIGPSGNPNFGKITNRSLDPNFKREYNLQYSAGIQHELRPGTAVSFNWYRRLLYNTQFSDDYSINAIYSGPDANWSPVTVINPLNGEQITAFQINQNKFGITPDIHLSTYTDSSKRSNIYNGFELSTSARLPRRITVLAGWTFDKTVDVSCNSTDNPNTFRFCDQTGNALLGEPAVSIPYLHEFKFNANVPVGMASTSAPRCRATRARSRPRRRTELACRSPAAPRDIRATAACPDARQARSSCRPASPAIPPSRCSWRHRARGTSRGGISSTSA